VQYLKVKWDNKMKTNGNDIMNDVSLFVQPWNDSRKYNMLTELLNDDHFSDLVVKGSEDYGSMTKSFEHWNELFFVLSKGKYRYTSFKSWNNTRSRKINESKKKKLT
jgi:hypothetical protein